MTTSPWAAAGLRLAPDRCFVIAEAGVNHNGNVELARRLIDAASAAGADAVKFQTFDPDLLASPAAPKAEYQRASGTPTESQHEMLRRLALPPEVFADLFRYAGDRGILFLSTPFDETSADLLDALGVAALKVPSGELTNHAFLAHVAGKGRPLLVSTGMSDLAEVSAALTVIRASGDPPVALFHCVSRYPARPDECNLRAIETMRSTFDVPVGWSDHTEGIEIALAAVALGAELLEKHFTLDRNLPGPDHSASLEPAELTRLVAAVRAVESARGDGVKRPTPAELDTARVVRRSLHARRDLPKGHVLVDGDLVALRPGTGLAPAARGDVIGRALLVALRRGEILGAEHLA
jgi:N,N'-diacetyllegionaminate synthase